ncbi:HRDC domain-containing protein, partial [Micrococcus sp. SIMBA_131]
GAQFLREKPTLMLRVPRPPAKGRSRRTTGSDAASALAPADAELFKALREKRIEIARAQNLPPYVIFHDRTLIEMAAVRPASRQAMAGISGIG